MTFGEKIKKLRTENGLTQEELAEKIFVTRTAISKWETGNGYPGIDTLKELSALFEISIDELISDSDVENQKLLDKKRSRRFYFAAIALLTLAVMFTLLTLFLQISYFSIGSVVCVGGYLVCGLLSKPKYKRMQARKIIVPYLISRLVVFGIVVGVMLYTLLSL